MKILNIIILIFTALTFNACKKEATKTSGVASLAIINATSDASPIAINFASSSLVWPKNITQVYNNSFLEISLSTGNNRLNLISSADTTKPLINGGIYSFYIAGQVSHYDTLFTKDNIPSYGADSVAGARFINLCSDGQSLSINLVGNSTPDFSGLAYKKITAFKKYSAVSNVTNNGGYNYEIRDASGNVLATFNWTPAVFKNNTLVITGLVGNGSVSVFSVSNF